MSGVGAVLLMARIRSRLLVLGSLGYRTGVGPLLKLLFSMYIRGIIKEYSTTILALWLTGNLSICVLFYFCSHKSKFCINMCRTLNSSNNDFINICFR